MEKNPNHNNSAENAFRTSNKHASRKNGLFVPAIVGLTAISMAFSPLIVPAFAAKLSNQDYNIPSDWNLQFTPSGVDSRLAQLHKERLANQKSEALKGNGLFTFTPAGLDKISNRTLTVAARAHDDVAKAVTVRNAIASNSAGQGSISALKTTKYSLKQDKGWKGFELSALPKLSSNETLGRLNRISSQNIDFKLDDDKNDKPSKFHTSLKVGKPQEAAPSPLGNAAGEDYVLNVGGSFSISKRIDLTAGVRYDRQNDIPLATNDDREDSESVYVGTKIRF